MSRAGKEILDALLAVPEGLTTNELSAQLGLRPDNLSSRMSKLFAYGVIDRLRTKKETGQVETKWKAGSGAPAPR